MLKTFVTVAVLACLIGSVGVAQTPAAGPSAREPEITASGRGEVRLAPAYAAVIVNVTTRANTAVVAASQNAQKVEATMKALRSAGLAEKDIVTSGYNLQQVYEHPPNRSLPEPVGFSANTTLRAEVRRIESLGRVIDAAINAGATGISGIQFFGSNTDEARRSAMVEAVREARADADAIARAAGGSLGRLIALNSGGVSQPFAREMYNPNLLAAAASVATRIVPGELTVTALVSGRWEFIPGTSR